MVYDAGDFLLGRRRPAGQELAFGEVTEPQIAEVAHIPNEFTIVCSFQTGQDIGHPVKNAPQPRTLLTLCSSPLSPVQGTSSGTTSPASKDPAVYHRLWNRSRNAAAASP